MEIEERLSKILRRLDRQGIDPLEKSGLEGSEPPRELADDQGIALVAMMGVNVWTAISVIGARYCYGSPFPW